MIPNLGNFKEDAIVYIMFNTFSSDDPSVSCTITNFLNTDVHIHKDDGLAQRNNAAGITVSVDFDGITGSHMIKIDTNDDTVAGFWVTGKDYFVRIEGTTVDGGTINAVVGRFSIENRFNEVDVVKWLGQACVAVTVNGVPEVDITHLLGTAWLAPGVAGTPDVNAKQLGGTNQAGRDIGTSVLLSTGSGAGQLDFTSGVVKSNLAQILGTALTETAGWLAAGFKKLFNVATPVLVASDVMRGTDGANTTVPDVAGVAATPAEVATALTDINLDHLCKTATAGADMTAEVVDNSILSRIIASGDTSVFDPATDSLQDIRDKLTDVEADTAAILVDTGTDGVVVASASKTGYALSSTGADLILKNSTFALAIADAVCDEVLTGATHNINNSLGRRVREIGACAIHSGTAQTGASYSITLEAGASANDGIYNRNLIVLVNNTGNGQTRTIVDYNGTSKVAVVDREWRVEPDATTEYQLLPDDTPLVVDHGVAQAGSTSTTIKLRAYASAVNNVYLCNIVIIIAGTGRGQARLVGAYNGTTKVITICGDNWITTPDDTSVYVMVPYGTTCTSCIGDHALSQFNTEMDNVLDTAIPGSPTADSINEKIKTLPSGISKNAGLNNFEFLMVLSSDHISPATGKTVACQRSIDGAAFGNCNSATATEVSAGVYKLNLAASDLNGDIITLKFSEATCDTTIITIKTES